MRRDDLYDVRLALFAMVSDSGRAALFDDGAAALMNAVRLSPHLSNGLAYFVAYGFLSPGEPEVFRNLNRTASCPPGDSHYYKHQILFWCIVSSKMKDGTTSREQLQGCCPVLHLICDRRVCLWLF